MYSYTYNSDVGTFEIKRIGHEMYELWIEDELLGSYECAEFAANDVSSFNTGYIEWDTFENELKNFPSDLSKWRVTEEVPQQ